MDPIVVKTPDNNWEITLNIAAIGVPTPTPTPVPTPVPPIPPPPALQEPVIPANAVVLNILPMKTWKMNHDAGTSGSSKGTTTFPVIAPDGTQNCRLFDFTNSGGGGEIYHLQALADSSKYSHFCVELEQLSPDWSKITNCEVDIEQVDANGVPLDMASQEDGYSGVFDVTESHHWTGTGVKVDPTKRAANSHHTKRIYFENLGGGKVLYPGVKLDDVYYPLMVTASDPDNSKWTPKDLNLQVQFDSKSATSGESKVYMPKLNIYCW